MTHTVALQPWDETPMRRKLMEVLVELERVRLSDLRDLPPVPGIYAQFFSTPAVESVLSSLISSGVYPAYIGVAAVNLRERIGRYRQSIAGIRSISEQDIHIAVMPCASGASAVFAESAAISELKCPLQGTGWGSKVPGTNRKEASPVDALFPGRNWAAPAPLAAEADARLRVLSRLIRLDPAGPRWPALPACPDPVGRLAGPRARVTHLEDRATRHGGRTLLRLSVDDDVHDRSDDPAMSTITPLAQRARKA